MLPVMVFCRGRQADENIGQDRIFISYFIIKFYFNTFKNKFILIYKNLF